MLLQEVLWDGNPPCFRELRDDHIIPFSGWTNAAAAREALTSWNPYEQQVVPVHVSQVFSNAVGADLLLAYYDLVRSSETWLVSKAKSDVLVALDVALARNGHADSVQRVVEAIEEYDWNYVSELAGFLPYEGSDTSDLGSALRARIRTSAKAQQALVPLAKDVFGEARYRIRAMDVLGKVLEIRPEIIAGLSAKDESLRKTCVDALHNWLRDSCEAHCNISAKVELLRGAPDGKFDETSLAHRTFAVLHALNGAASHDPEGVCGVFEVLVGPMLAHLLAKDLVMVGANGTSIDSPILVELTSFLHTMQQLGQVRRVSALLQRHLASENARVQTNAYSILQRSKGERLVYGHVLGQIGKCRALQSKHTAPTS